MTTYQKEMWKAILRCVRLGWPIVLIYGIVDGFCACGDPECRTAGKHPIMRRGVKDATIKLAQIKELLKKHPNANIAIATGEEAGILVFDVDTRNGGDQTLKQLEQAHGKLPPIITSITGGGGYHFYFAYPSFPVRKDNAGRLLGPGIDVQSDKSYVVEYPSRHASGEPYTWFKGRAPIEIELAELPENWAKLLNSSVKREIRATLNAPPIEKVLEGHRNSHLARVGGVQRRLGASESVILAVLTVENEEKCDPPLDQSEVEAIAKSIARYPAGLISNTSSDVAHGVMNIVLDREFDGGRTLLHTEDGGFWRYDGKIWLPARRDRLENRILATLEELPQISGRHYTGIMSEVLTLLRAKLAVEGDVLRLTSEPPPVINCRNGELWLTADLDLELRRHSPDRYLRHRLDRDYDADALCPRFDAAMEDICAGSSNPKDMVRHILEVIGRTIFPDRSDAVIIVFYGRGANGKTALLDIIINLLGPQLVHAGQLEEIDKNRFIHGNLLGKLMFVDDDVRAGARLPDGALKKISERKLLTADKKYRDPINFYCLAAPFLLCNNLPSIVDLSPALRRRLMVIPFDRTFSPAEAKNSPFPAIMENEMSGVLNRALEGYKRYRKRGHFKLPQDVQKATDDWMAAANPLKSFIAEECVKNSNFKWLLSDFYARYSRWAQEAGVTWVLQRNILKRNLEHLDFKVVHTNKGIVVVGLAPRRGGSST
jgi:P4 family phage/plasmid primase-like protien